MTRLYNIACDCISKTCLLFIWLICWRFKESNNTGCKVPLKSLPVSIKTTFLDNRQVLNLYRLFFTNLHVDEYMHWESTMYFRPFWSLLIFHQHFISTCKKYHVYCLHSCKHQDKMNWTRSCKVCYCTGPQTNSFLLMPPTWCNICLGESILTSRSKGQNKLISLIIHRIISPIYFSLSACNQGISLMDTCFTGKKARGGNEKRKYISFEEDSKSVIALPRCLVFFRISVCDSPLPATRWHFLLRWQLEWHDEAHTRNYAA